MILKQLNEKLGPKLITAEGNTKDIGKLVKEKTGKEFIEVRRERSIRVKSKRDPVVPQRMSVKNQKPTFHSNQYVLKRQEEQIAHFDDTLSLLDPAKIKKIKDDHKASQKVYSTYQFEKVEKMPPTRLEKNMMMFKEIFIEPEIKRIESLKVKEAEFTNLVHNVINQQYDKLLEVQFKKIHPGMNKTKRPLTAAASQTNFSKRPMSTATRVHTFNDPESIKRTMRIISAKPAAIVRPRTGLPVSGKKQRIVQSAFPAELGPNGRYASQRPISKYKQEYEQEIDEIFEESEIVGSVGSLVDERCPEVVEELINQRPRPQNGAKAETESFFEQPIFLQLPEMPNSSIASTLTPGFGWAPSLPHLRSLKFSKEEISNMMLRAKCGVKSGDQQKEAHMLFYMGIVYENKGNYRKSVRFFKAFHNLAKRLVDKIGMGFALNRICCGHYYLGDYVEAIHQNQRCLALMDKDNVYAALYNSGIFLRRVGKCRAALEEFQKAIEWSVNRDDEESECLVLGQMALTLHLMGEDERALEYYEKCREKSTQVDNPKLALDSLINSLKIRELDSIKSNNKSKAPLPHEYYQVLSVAHMLGENTIAERCKVSMAVMEGDKRFNDYIREHKNNLTSKD